MRLGLDSKGFQAKYFALATCSQPAVIPSPTQCMHHPFTLPSSKPLVVSPGPPDRGHHQISSVFPDERYARMLLRCTLRVTKSHEGCNVMPPVFAKNLKRPVYGAWHLHMLDHRRLHCIAALLQLLLTKVYGGPIPIIYDGSVELRLQLGKPLSIIAYDPTIEPVDHNAGLVQR